MEATTVSTLTASLTGGDYLCETDVTNVAIHSVTLLICLCGLPRTGAVLFILKCCNTGIFLLALVAFLFLLLAVRSALLFLVEDMSCSPIMPQQCLNFFFQLSVVSCFWALFQLMLRRSSVYMFKLYNLCCCCCNLPKHQLRWVFCVQYLVFYILVIICLLLTYVCPSHQQEHCRAALISMYTFNLLLSAAPVVISSTIDFINANRGSTEQQPQRCDIVMFLMVHFLLLLSLCNVLQQLGYTVVSSELFLLLNCIQSSIKPFIYLLAGGFQRPCSLRSLQLSLQRVFDNLQEEVAHRNYAPMDTGI